MKRAADLVGSLLALVVLAPLMLLVSLAVLFRMGRPVLFRQVRTGLDGRPFEVHKFRTMAKVAGPDDGILSDGRRITPLGRWLRRLSLDELPQLFNVLRGDMSIVGPRPLPEVYLPSYADDQLRRHSVRPGITGLAQVRGRNAVCMAEKLQMDLFYVDNQSLWLDARIALQTVGVLRDGAGAAPEGYRADKMPCVTCDDWACPWGQYNGRASQPTRVH